MIKLPMTTTKEVFNVESFHIGEPLQVIDLMTGNSWHGLLECVEETHIELLTLDSGIPTGRVVLVTELRNGSKQLHHMWGVPPKDEIEGIPRDFIMDTMKHCEQLIGCEGCPNFISSSEG